MSFIISHFVDMFRRSLLCCVLSSLVRLLLAGQLRCDKSTDAMVHDGNIGESGIFNWLGILRVHLHDGDNTKIALTGVVLIKENFVLANADDIARIPMNIFKQESQIMFIPQNATPWYCRPLKYMTHPEYQYSTYNTIAIVELALDDVETYPLKPICWPRRMMNTSNHLYVAGYTDDNKFLEKIVYKMHYVDQTTCDQFYKKAGLSAESRTPLYYQCGFTESDHENCVWDNGMALISNVTGWFSLVGLGVRGPGCAAPSRYIDVYQYLQWLDMVTADNEIDDYGDFRRTQKKDNVEYVPAHELLRSNSSKFKGFHFNTYAFDAASMQFFNVEQTEPNAFNISPFNDTYENIAGSCEVDIENKYLVYSEHFKIQTSPKSKGQVSYKLTLYDFLVANITCVKLKIDCSNRSEATLYYAEVMDFEEGTAVSNSGETPDEVFRYYYIKKGMPNETKGPDPFLKPEFLKASWPGRAENVINVNLILKLEFEGEAILKFEMYGELRETSTATPDQDSRRDMKVSNNRSDFHNTREDVDTVTTTQQLDTTTRLDDPTTRSVIASPAREDVTEVVDVTMNGDNIVDSSIVIILLVKITVLICNCS